MNRHGWIGAGIVVAALLAGCDKPAPPPVVSSKPPTQATQPAGPTTQELLNGPYKHIALTPTPFSAKAPESWQNKIPEGANLNFLQGPGPGGGEIQISLEIGKTVPSELIKSILDHAQKAADADKQKVRLFQIRKMGDIQVMEEQNLFTGDGQQMIDWKLTFFVHRDIDYATYVVDLLGLPVDQFEASKPLLQKVFDSITYDPTAAIPGRSNTP